MTLPSSIILPLKSDYRAEETDAKYFRDLNFSLVRMYESVAQAVNGSIRNNALTGQEKWTPTLNGATTSGTFTYTNQIGWVLRQGVLVDIWFDITWSAAGTAAGNLYIELPYRVAISSQKPFVGPLQTATIAYGAGQSVLTINGIPNTYRGEIWSSGSGNAMANIAVAAAGQLIGHLRYIGNYND